MVRGGQVQNHPDPGNQDAPLITHRLARTRCGWPTDLADIHAHPLHPVQIGKTTLWFPKGLAAIYGTKKQWATGGAFLM